MIMICFMAHISEENQKGVQAMAMHDWNHDKFIRSLPVIATILHILVVAYQHLVLL